jgi:hypothetical protein
MLDRSIFGLPVIIMMKSGIEIHGKLISEDSNSITMAPTNTYSGSKRVEIQGKVLTIPFTSIEYASTDFDEIIKRSSDPSVYENLKISMEGTEK